MSFLISFQIQTDGRFIAIARGLTYAASYHGPSTPSTLRVVHQTLNFLLVRVGIFIAYALAFWYGGGQVAYHGLDVGRLITSFFSLFNAMFCEYFSTRRRVALSDVLLSSSSTASVTLLTSSFFDCFQPSLTSCQLNSSLLWSLARIGVDGLADLRSTTFSLSRPHIMGFHDCLLAQDRIRTEIERTSRIDHRNASGAVSFSSSEKNDLDDGRGLDIELRNVSFAFPSRLHQKSLDNVSLTIPRGKVSSSSRRKSSDRASGIDSTLVLAGGRPRRRFILSLPTYLYDFEADSSHNSSRSSFWLR